jgi:uncharacterized protein (DUF1330 family)
MASKTVFTQVKTTQSLEEVTDAVTTSMRRLGGQVFPRGGTIEVIDGNAGVSCAFVAKFQAFVSITRNKKKENTFDIDCQIRWSPNSIFWICLIAGLCLVFTWIGNLLYLFIDPVSQYQQALDRVQAELD